MSKEKKENVKEFKNINEVLNYIQVNLKAPKNQVNKFGNYNYRSCEDILEAVKSLLDETGAYLTITDEIISVGDRIYIKAISKLVYGDNEVVTSALAREPEDKKGMDTAQITGATSSYARKYALNGLFCIDDNKQDPDNNKPEDNQEIKKYKDFNSLYKALPKEIGGTLADKFHKDKDLIMAVYQDECKSDFDKFIKLVKMTKSFKK